MASGAQIISSLSSPYITMQIDDPALQSIMNMLNSFEAGNLSNTYDAVEEATGVVQAVWIRNASGNVVDYMGSSFTVRRRTGRYIRAIQAGFVYPVGSDPLHGRVAANVPYAIYIEKGTRALSGAEARARLLRSPKAKMSKDGYRYIRIPFSHVTPGSGKTGGSEMPAPVYEKAKKLKPGSLPNIRGGRLHMPEYGIRTKIKTLKRPFAPYTWKSGPYEGMYRGDVSSKKQKAMGMGQSKYMTVRTVSERTPASSEAWAKPEVPPRPIARATAHQSLPTVLQIIREGVISDMTGYIRKV